MIIRVKLKEKTLKFYLGRRSDFTAFYKVFVEQSYLNLLANIKKGDTVIDAGANIGVFTVIASTLVGTEGQVVSIEPDPENVRTLKKNVELNELKNVEIIDRALYKESGRKIKFIQNGVMSRIVPGKTDVNADYIEVETVTLDDIVGQRAIRRSILKMDIEGAEKFALLSAESTMKTVSYLEGEIHSREDFDVLMRFSNLFSFERQPIESLYNVILFSLKHPLKILKLEYYNKFRTTKRVIFSLGKHSKPSEYPMIIYGKRFP